MNQTNNISSIWKDSRELNNRMSNSILASIYLKTFFPSDEIVLDEYSTGEILEFRESITGSNNINDISDVFWSKTIPIMDFIVKFDKRSLRFAIFEESIENIETITEGRVGLVGVLQELSTKTFVLVGVKSGTHEVDISKEIFREDGSKLTTMDENRHETACRLWSLWHGIQLALLHPKLKVILSNGKTRKEYYREKDKTTGKRKRVVRYIKTHYITEGEISEKTKEFTRHCKAWYVIGHFRHYPSGKVGYVKGHWKGEMRELKKNIDSGRTREIETNRNDEVLEIRR